MAQFGINGPRVDPYKNFKFRVKWDGRYVADVSKVGGLNRTSEIVKHRKRGYPKGSRKSLGRPKHEPITLVQGITRDVEFEKWARNIWNVGSGFGVKVPPGDFRKDVNLEMYNEAAQLTAAYRFRRCWASDFQGLPELDQAGNAILIEKMVLQNEGWERDTEVSEPQET